MYHHLIKTTLVVAMAVAMAGCGTKAIKPTERKPAKLLNIQSPVTVLTQVSSIRLDQGKSTLKRSRAKARDVIDLQVAPTANGVIAASRGGLVSAFVNGATVWQLNVDDAITSAVGMDTTGSLAVVGTRSGKIVAIDAKTGTERWSVNLPSSSLAPALVTAQVVIVSTNSGTTYGLSSATGETVWQYNAQSPSTSVRGMAKPLQLDAQTAILGGSDGRIHALDIHTGEPLWTRRIGLAKGVGEIDKLRDVDGTPVFIGNHLYAASYSGQLTGFDMATGRLMFASELSSTDRLAILANAIIGSSTDGEVVAFDRFTGDKLWENDELKYRSLTNPVAIGQNIAVGDKSGVIHVLNSQGKIISRVSTKGELTSLQVVNNRLYTQSANGVVSVWQF
ncbi:outer membrane protein assembly factor BamB [Moraxella marmotae]|uniref:outer membrane protein assembly factor BamB n=1 Tax=Moraxella marmotae TaxID=3344520 RepID=UPI0035F32068